MKRSLTFLCLFLLLSWTAVQGQVVPNANHWNPHQHGPETGAEPTTTTHSIQAIDRFGQAIEPAELAMPATSRSGQATCQAGHFTLCFEDVALGRDYGFDDPLTGQQRRNIVCRAFTDLSTLIQSPGPAGNVRVQVQASEGTDPNGFTVNVLAPSAAAVASDINLLGFQGGITYGMVWRALVSGNDPYAGLQAFGFTNNSFHGMIRVNFNDIPYYLMDLMNPNQPVPAGESDLYTAVLHEAIHLLGFYSLIDATNNNQSVFAPGSPSLYNRYDLNLELQQGGGTPLVNYTAPYTVTPTNLILNAGPTNCSVPVDFNGSATIGQPMYMPSGANWTGSGLSHVNCDPGNPTGCATSNGYVMNTCLPRGTAQRHLHPEEVNMLCDLGYTIPANPFFGTNAPAGSNFDNFQQYTSCSGIACLPVGQSDAANTMANTAVSVSVAQLIANDLNATGIHATSLEVMGGNGVGQVTLAGGTVTFTPSPLFAGTAVVRYLPICNGVPGALTYLVIDVAAAPIAACQLPPSSCNIVCNGDMEDLWALSNNSDFRILYNGSASGNSPDYMFPGQLFPFGPTGICGNTPPTGGSNLAFSQPNDNYASISGYGSVYEALTFALSQPLQDNTTYELTYLSSTGCAGNRLAVAFSEEPPCTGPAIFNHIYVQQATPGNLGTPGIPGGMNICPTYNPEFWTDAPIGTPAQGQTWVRNTVQFNGVPAGTNLDNMIVMVLDRHGGHVILDDFTLEVVSPDQLDVETMVATTSCEGDEFAITYTICSDQAVNGLSLNVALPPLGMHYTAGGDFTNGVLNGLAIPANGCVDVTLNVGFDAGTAVGTAFNLQLDATGSTFCLSTTSQVNTLLTKLAPANNPLSMTLVDITNTPPYSAGDLVDLEVTFTNSDPTQAVTQVNTAATAVFPLQLTANNIPPTFTVNPNSSVTYTYQVQIGTASFCDLVETCVVINSASNACGLPMSACVNLDVQNAQWPLVQIQFNKGITADLQEDPTGNVYLTGHLVSGTVNNQSQTGSSFFLSKIDECGQEEWGRRSFPLPGGNGWSDSYSVTRDNANNVYISGAHREGVTFEGGSNNDLTVFTFGGVNNPQYGYIASYTEDGDLRWVLQQLNMNHSEINEVQFDPNTGDLYATGTADHNQGSFFILYTQTGVSFAGILNASPNPPHSRAATTMRLTTNGQIAWNRHFITDGNTYGRYLDFFSKQVIVLADRVLTKSDRPTQLIHYTNSGIEVGDEFFRPMGPQNYQNTGLEVSANGMAFVQATVANVQTTYLSKYKISGPTIGAVYHSPGINNSFATRHSLAMDELKDQVILQLAYNLQSPIGLMVSVGLSANSWNQAVAAPVIHDIYTASAGTMTRGDGGNLYSAGSIPGTSAFNLISAPVTTTTVGFRDFYVTRYKYNNGGSNVFSKLAEAGIELPEGIEPFLPASEWNLTLYPNPAIDQVTLAWDGVITDEQVTVEIIDITGRVMWSGQESTVGSSILLNTIDLHAGNYFVRMTGTETSEVKALVIQR